MRNPLLTATATFLLGLSLGSLVMGQRSESPPKDETESVASRDPVTAPNRENGDPDNLLALISKPDADPQGEEISGDDDSPVSIDFGPVSGAEQIRILAARWVNQENLIGRLEKRVRGLERQLVNLRTEFTHAKDKAPEPATEALPLATPEDRRSALVAAGVAESNAEDIVRKQSEWELDRLELQDQALREGWYGTDRYSETLRELSRDAIDLRTEIGERAYDEYLFQTGESNRIKVTSVIQGSAAEQSGLLPGDIIETYGDAYIYDYSDLRSATADGVRGETVPVLIRRGDNLIEAEIARGPMGIRLEPLNFPPSS